jgi:hypothetical protein
MKKMIKAMEADWNYDQITIGKSSKGINDQVIMYDLRKGVLKLTLGYG